MRRPFQVKWFFLPLLSILLACQPSTEVEDRDSGPDESDGDPGDSSIEPGDTDPDPWPDGGDPVVDADRPPDDGICTDVIDLVFVLDVSSSMSFVLDQLEAQIGSVVAASNALAEGSHFGLVGFVDNHALDLTGDLEGGLVHSDAPTLQAAFHHLREVYTTPNRNPGDGPDGPTMQNPICEENALDALEATALEFPWRDNATRVVILVTDDTFVERPDNYGDRDGDGRTDLTDFPREGDYPALTTLAEAVAALQAARVRVFAFARTRAPGMFAPSRCGTGRRLPWPSVSNGWHAPYNGQPPIPEATDARAYDVDLVRNGSLSLVETINEVVVNSYCHELVY
jgi:hypothetical protein